MKFIIFGSGLCYRNFKHHIKNEDIVCFVDNNREKQGTCVDGRPVISLEEADFSGCDYVLVFIVRYQPAVEQLRRLGAGEEKIRIFYELGEMLGMEAMVRTSGGMEPFSRWSDSSAGKQVMLVAHELTRNGVAVVLMHLAMLLEKMGYRVVVASLFGGGLEEELGQQGIACIPDLGLFYRSERFRKAESDMAFVVLGTIGLADVAESLSGTGVPVIWWIHESNDRDFQDFPLIAGSQFRYCAGGRRVADKFHQYYPDWEIRKLLYFLPDRPFRKSCQGRRFRVAVIGALSYRKGQDIFVKAVRMLPEEKRADVDFDLVGTEKEPVPGLDQALSDCPQLHVLGEMTQSGLEEYFTGLDILVCPSRDDPMPVVVTQAMEYGIVCIVSDQTGQSEYISHGRDGFVFESGNVPELGAILMYCMENRNILSGIGARSRQIYDDFFSETAMELHLGEIINRCSEITV